MVRAIAADHGGDLRFESEEGCGTVVTITVPGCIDIHWPSASEVPSACDCMLVNRKNAARSTAATTAI